MQILPPIAQLDAILLLLNNDTVLQDDGHIVEIVPLNFKEIQKRLDFKINDRDITLMLQKLEKDGHIYSVTKIEQGYDLSGNPISGNVTRYWINFDGKYFILDGGYVQKAKNDLLEIQIEQDELKRRKYNDFLLAEGTKWVAIGTIALFSFEIVKFILEHYCCCWFF